MTSNTLLQALGVPNPVSFNSSFGVVTISILILISIFLAGQLETFMELQTADVHEQDARQRHVLFYLGNRSSQAWSVTLRQRRGPTASHPRLAPGLALLLVVVLPLFGPTDDRRQYEEVRSRQCLPQIASGAGRLSGEFSFAAEAAPTIATPPCSPWNRQISTVGGCWRPIGVEAVDLHFPRSIGLLVPDRHVLPLGEHRSAVMLGGELERSDGVTDVAGGCYLGGRRLPVEIESGHGGETFPRGANRVSSSERSAEWHEVGILRNERQECVGVIYRFRPGFVNRHERVAFALEIDSRGL